VVAACGRRRQTTTNCHFADELVAPKPEEFKHEAWQSAPFLSSEPACEVASLRAPGFSRGCCLQTAAFCQFADELLPPKPEAFNLRAWLSAT
jgi:hypothetical protein